MKKDDDVITASASINFFSYKIGIRAAHIPWMTERLNKHNASKNVS